MIDEQLANLTTAQCSGDDAILNQRAELLKLKSDVTLYYNINVGLTLAALGTQTYFCNLMYLAPGP